MISVKSTTRLYCCTTRRPHSFRPLTEEALELKRKKVS
jgi:hypothetical protein